ncbi:endonuclease/exonuclease/phosphatase family protein [Sphingobacterium bovistauri]|uniref:Endonuclease/exonuclease/phosphatase family protein n=1 Tax=Sphingobacterium bovistauri TaxID=2781959 RepID=A0ABS7Z653_9SPHI|nr:endonuclease/exonuclease/phosphatase family protein [Sphingobacterium bovistauri]MCA5005037.1 endonuclease/exonuclease/phosphatase family protein [Sphingobacterium bovistauri]
MKKLVSIAILLCCIYSVSAQSFHVATYNIRQRNQVDTGNLWIDRKEKVANQIKYHEFDIFGVQEAFKDQMDDMQKLLPKYNWVGVGRDDGKDKGEYSAIFYKKERFRAIKSGTFWLSSTNTESPNKGWDAALPRICTWGIFEDEANSKQFIIMNTHFDHIGKTARKESAKLMLQKAKELAKGLPLIICGDLNVNEKDEAYFTLANSTSVEDTYYLSPIVYEPSSTFNGWGKNIKEKGRIDHIFVSKPFNVLKYGILTDTYIGKYPSDHFPVSVQLEW